MKITLLREIEKEEELSSPDEARSYGYIQMTNVQLTGRNTHYPNCLIHCENMLLSPYDERVMSLQKDSFYDNNEYTDIIRSDITQEMDTPVFFFIYNVDNYFHFIYDTLPMLYTYFYLKKKYDDLKLLIATAHPQVDKLAIFVKETFSLFGIEDNSLILHKEGTLYHKMYVSESLTHGGMSNEKPGVFAKNIWQSIQTDAVTPIQNSPKRIYVSRRSWLSKQPENIGTNYTLRRKCVNEDQLVYTLRKYGFVEMFLEDLSMEQKIRMFQSAEIICGVIGGGMCNTLFSQSSTKVLCLLTPDFLRINERFKHSMSHTQIQYLDICKHASYDGLWSPYTRLKINDSSSTYLGKIGELVKYDKDSDIYSIQITMDAVAGFSVQFPTKTVQCKADQLIALDNGLNSPYECDISLMEEHLNKMNLYKSES